MDPTTLQFTGNALLNEGKYEKALECFLPAAAIDPAAALGAGLAYWKLGKSSLAAPLLRQAKAAFPEDPSLQRALYATDKEEIVRLSEKLLTTQEPAERQNLYRTLAVLHEETWNYAEAARTYVCSLPSRPDYYAIIRAAYLLKMAKNYDSAASFYQQAAKVSTAPAFPLMWSVDCLLLANQNKAAEELLKKLQDNRPGPDLEWYWARLYRARGEKEKARDTLRALGAQYEKEARAGRDVRNNRLSAAKAYVDGGDPERGIALLDKMAARSAAADPEIDALRAGYYFDRKDYLPAMAIYRRHPDSVPMQVALGWALSAAGTPDSAQRHFQELMNRFPHRPEVIEGWQALGNYRPWGVFYIATRLDYGDYQDPRDLHTLNLKYSGNRTTTTFSYTRTDTHASPGAFDFSENLLGIRCYRQLDDRSGAQLHGLAFQNDDYLTDNGWTVGGRYYWLGRSKCTWHVELDTSQYPDLAAVQASLGMSYQLSPHWGWSFGVDGGFLQGDEASRAETRTPAGLRFGVTFSDHNAVVTLSGKTGERILAVDSDGLYAYNGLDTYRNGASLMILQKAQNLELFLNLGTMRITSEVLRTAKTPRGTPVSADYRMKTISLGANFKFF